MLVDTTNAVEKVANTYWTASLAWRHPSVHGIGWTCGRLIEVLRGVSEFQRVPRFFHLASGLMEEVINDEKTNFDGQSVIIPLHKEGQHPLCLLERLHGADYGTLVEHI
jgi:hypothetical protein